MKILILILARGGSKRLPNKNKRILGTLPLIQWTINFAKKLDSYPIMLSTDDKDIYEIGNKNNILTPWLRPKKLSRDKTSSAQAAIHAIDWYEKNFNRLNGIILLQPTSPFRSIDFIKRGIQKFKKSKCAFIAVREKKGNTDGLIIKKRKGFYLEKIKDKSNTKSKIYIPTGSFYIINPQDLRKHLSFFSTNTKPLIIKKNKYQIDIDTEKDFNYAEKYI